MRVILGSPTAAPPLQFSDNSVSGFSIFHKEVADYLFLERVFSEEETGAAEAGGRHPCGNSLRIRTRRGRSLPVVNGNMHATHLS